MATEHEVRLADRVRTRGVLSPDDAARLLLPVAGTLNLLHRSGSSHGAVSPASVLVDSEGRARLLAAADADPDPAYVAPDPNFGLVPHPESADVWALAALLHLVTVGEPPGPSGGRATGWLGPVLDRALHTDPARRPSMAELIDDLRPHTGTPAGPPTPPAPPAALSEPATPLPRTASHRRTRQMGPAVVGAAVIAVLAIVGSALLLSGGDGDEATDARSGDQSATPTMANDPTTDAPSGDTPTPTPSEEPATAEELEAFARTYVRTASTNPARGYALLTAGYQRQSPRYHEVWSAIQNPRVLSVSGDPESLTVTYTYRYGLSGGGRRTEEVTLQLVERGDGFLISGATARLL